MPTSVNDISLSRLGQQHPGRPISLNLEANRGRLKSWTDSDSGQWIRTPSSSDDHSEAGPDEDETSSPASLASMTLDAGNHDLVASIYAFLKAYLSSPELSHDPLDARIAQALDLITSMLKTTVRSEVEKYEDRIDQLKSMASKLQTENETLKQHVDDAVLQRFQQQQQQRQQQQQQQLRPRATTVSTGLRAHHKVSKPSANPLQIKVNQEIENNNNSSSNGDVSVESLHQLQRRLQELRQEQRADLRRRASLPVFEPQPVQQLQQEQQEVPAEP